MAREGVLKGRVLGYAHGLVLLNSEFHVSEAGRQRVLKSKRKNIHAQIVGELVAATGYRTRIHNAGLKFEYCGEDKWLEIYPGKWTGRSMIGTEITYNPYKNSTFVVKGSHSRVDKADVVHIFHGRAEAYFTPRKNTGGDK